MKKYKIIYNTKSGITYSRTMEVEDIENTYSESNVMTEIIDMIKNYQFIQYEVEHGFKAIRSSEIESVSVKEMG